MTYRETQEVIERFLAFWTEEGDRGDHWPPFRSSLIIHVLTLI